MSIPSPVMGRPTKYGDLIRIMLKKRKKYLSFDSRSQADACATYYRNHHTGTAAVRKIGEDFRVYVEVA